jgi:lysozyme family protein/peptidoglycan hydrolase-like protein with peptidoglycan-binding domain
MASFTEYEAAYEHNWANLEIRENRLQDARNQATRLLRGKQTYQEIEAKTGVPWWFTGLCHYRESNFNFGTYLGNGQSLGAVTTIVPKGRGPFTGSNAFVDGAVDALRIQGFLGAQDWGIARVLYRLEGFNGYGYHGFGVNSPYLYGGSTIYGPPQARGGKYVADHTFDPSAVDTQLGTAVILKALLALDSSIKFDGTGSTGPISPAEPDDDLAKNILWLQQSLNTLGADPQLTEDGMNGPRTMAAVSKFQRQNGLQDTGLADAATIAAIQQKLTTPTTDGPGQGDLLAAIKALIDQLQRRGGITMPWPGSAAPANDLTGILQQVANVLQNFNIAPKTTIPLPAQQQDQAAQLQKVLDFVSGLVNPGGKSQPLGQVNGALGQTIGKLLNGNKTAIGIIGALVTALLGNVPAGSGLADILAKITPFAGAAGFSGYALPIFLALSAWGALGKIEKWAQGTAPPPVSTK